MRRVLSTDQETELYEYFGGALEQAGGLRSTLGHQLDVVATMGTVAPQARSAQRDDPLRLLLAAKTSCTVAERLARLPPRERSAVAAYFAPLPPGLTEGLLDAFADDEREDPRKVHSSRRGLAAVALWAWEEQRAGEPVAPGASAAAALRELVRSARGKKATAAAADRVEALRRSSRLLLLEGLESYAFACKRVTQQHREERVRFAFGFLEVMS